MTPQDLTAAGTRQVNFKLTIEYDGTHLYGWQRQTNLPTVQGELEKILSVILNQQIKIHGSGRTDAGVHAMAQVAHFKACTAIAPRAIKKGVNRMMRHPIVIHECDHAPQDFHAQYNAISKEYRYYILNRPEPCGVGKHYIWHVNRPLDVEIMNRCAAQLVGTHDFKAFENTGSPRSSTIRQVFTARWESQGDHRLVFRICASGFLKNMVRNIVGTLKDAGTGRITPDGFKTILTSCSRPLAGATAPAKGLFLHKVNY